MSKTNLTPANAYTYGGNLAMSLPDNPICTAEDYWNLPEGERAELIDGQLYALASPSRIHQEIIIELTYHFQHYIKSNKGNCNLCCSFCCQFKRQRPNFCRTGYFYHL